MTCYEYVNNTNAYNISLRSTIPVTKAILHLPTGTILFYGNRSGDVLRLLNTLPDNLQTRGSLITPTGRFRSMWRELLSDGNNLYNSNLAPSWEALSIMAASNTLELIDI